MVTGRFATNVIPYYSGTVLASNTYKLEDETYGLRFHNNKMERMNGGSGPRARQHTLETTDTLILKGMQIFHNYVRPHMSLDGNTRSRGHSHRGREQMAYSDSECLRTPSQQ